MTRFVYFKSMAGLDVKCVRVTLLQGVFSVFSILKPPLWKLIWSNLGLCRQSCLSLASSHLKSRSSNYVLESSPKVWNRMRISNLHSICVYFLPPQNDMVCVFQKHGWIGCQVCAYHAATRGLFRFLFFEAASSEIDLVKSWGTSSLICSSSYFLFFSSANTSAATIACTSS